MSKTCVPQALRDRVAAQAKHRCGYCLSQQEVVGSLMEIDHLIPEALQGKTEETNLWLACRECNAAKGDHVTASDPQTGEVVPLFNPRQQRWNEHFAWTANGEEIGGVTAVGRATVSALGLSTARCWCGRAAGCRLAGIRPESDTKKYKKP